VPRPAATACGAAGLQRRMRQGVGSSHQSDAESRADAQLVTDIVAVVALSLIIWLGWSMTGAAIRCVRCSACPH
jgi:hypothetical protein